MLFQHANFITGGSDPIGSLANVTPQNADMGLLAFIRLVGSAYFKKHLTGFKHTTPEALFHSVTGATQDVQHRDWLNIIQHTVWERTYDESHYIPSYEALTLHWKRCTWVAAYWKKATDNEIQMPG